MAKKPFSKSFGFFHSFSTTVNPFYLASVIFSVSTA